MSPEKYQAGLRLNDLENQYRQINEGIARTEENLARAKYAQSLIAEMLTAQRAAVAAMPD